MNTTVHIVMYAHSILNRYAIQPVVCLENRCEAAFVDWVSARVETDLPVDEWHSEHHIVSSGAHYMQVRRRAFNASREIATFAKKSHPVHLRFDPSATWIETRHTQCEGGKAVCLRREHSIARSLLFVQPTDGYEVSIVHPFSVPVDGFEVRGLARRHSVPWASARCITNGQNLGCQGPFAEYASLARISNVTSADWETALTTMYQGDVFATPMTTVLLHREVSSCAKEFHVNGIPRGCLPSMAHERTRPSLDDTHGFAEYRLHWAPSLQGGANVLVAFDADLDVVGMSDESSSFFLENVEQPTQPVTLFARRDDHEPWVPVRLFHNGQPLMVRSSSVLGLVFENVTVDVDPCASCTEHCAPNEDGRCYTYSEQCHCAGYVGDTSVWYFHDNLGVSSCVERDYECFLPESNSPCIDENLDVCRPSLQYQECHSSDPTTIVNCYMEV